MKKLTKKRAIELSIELWEWLAETGKYKWDWPEWKKYGGVDAEGYGQVENHCFLCEKYLDKGACMKCPLGENFGCYRTSYMQWEDALTKPTRKKFAKLFLAQLKEL